jgi:hypothetical protein
MRVETSAGEMECRQCATTYRFRACGACEAVSQVARTPDGILEAYWRCTFCGHQNKIPRFRDWPAATAEQSHDELDRRGMLSGAASAEVRVVGGFTVIGGNGLGLSPSSVCSLLTLPDSLLIEVEIGENVTAAIRYEEMTALDVAGGAQTTGKTFFGGGFGLQGALEGIVIASALSAATKKTTVNTGMHVGSLAGEVLLHHGALTSRQIRTTLSPLWTRFEAARHAGPASSQQRVEDDPITLLTRLGELRTSGILTEDEFATKKAEILSRL